MRSPIMISVIGGGGKVSPQDLRIAEEVGYELARRGAVVVCGGLNGVMEAVCRGAKSANGVTIGILPGSDPTEANLWVDYPVCTGIGSARNLAVVKSGRAVIAIDGAYGTLSEIGHALGEGIPVIGLSSWELARKGQPDGSIIRASSPLEAVEIALHAVAARHHK